MRVSRLILVLAAIAVSPFVLAQPPLAPAPQFVMAPDKLPPKEVQEATLSLLAAIEAKDFANFVRVGHDEFKTDLSFEDFTRMVDLIAARQEKGYTIVYFGNLKNEPYLVHMWKLSFRDGDRELLGEISIRDGKVAGFHIH